MSNDMRSTATLLALDAAMEAAQDTAPRPYLGASGIGNACERALWYGWRGAATGRIAASGLRAIQDGFAGEDVMAARLRLIPGVELHTDDPVTGRQIGVEALDGHFRGHLDGAIRGLLEAPDVWHVWEHKQVNEAKFKKLVKLLDADEPTALEKWDFTYHAQAQVYMALTGMAWHYLTVGTPGGREYAAARTAHDPAVSSTLLARAERIISATEPPPRLSDDPAYYECKWCRSASVCHGDEAPVVSCRTCAHATPRRDEGAAGAWVCERGYSAIRLAPRAAHDCHLYIPALLSRVGVAVDADDESVTYDTPDGGRFVNGPAPGFTSLEIRAAKHKTMLADAAVQAVKVEFTDARLVA